MICPICRAVAAAPRIRKAGVDILACSGCGSSFWQPAQGFDAASIYGVDYFEGRGCASGYDDYASLEPALRRNFARRLRALGTPPAGARLLDLGAAYGFAIDEARRLGWRACGLEISAAAAKGSPCALFSGTKKPLAVNQRPTTTRLWMANATSAVAG